MDFIHPRQSCLWLLLAWLAVCSRSCKAKTENLPLTAYEQLEANGLPPNLLPNTIKSYTLQDDGYFELQLDGECYAEIIDGTVPLYYAPTLTGYLSDKKLVSLKGISVKPTYYTFLWLRVMTIYVTLSPDNVHIGVGFGLSEAIPLSEFSEDSPICIPNKVSRWSKSRSHGTAFWR